MANSELFALRYITTDRTQTSLKSLLKKTLSTISSLLLKTMEEYCFFPHSKGLQNWAPPQKAAALTAIALPYLEFVVGLFFLPIARLTQEVKNMKKLLVEFQWDKRANVKNTHFKAFNLSLHSSKAVWRSCQKIFHKLFCCCCSFFFSFSFLKINCVAPQSFPRIICKICNFWL